MRMADCTKDQRGCYNYNKNMTPHS